MITLYSYPELSGVADNNGYGLKVFAFLRLAGVDFTHEHVFDASAAPRGQLPYIVDDAEEIGDSDTIIAHVIAKYRLGMDDGLTPRQRDTNHLILRMLDDLYWVMSYSRWKDERYWPLFLESCVESIQVWPKRGCARRKNSIPSDTIIKASAATRQPRPTRGSCRSASVGEPHPGE